MAYVDGYVVSIPKKNLKAYQKMAETAGKVWMEYGALQYVECVGNDLKVMKGLLSFLKLVKPKKGETILFAWILYKSKDQRNQINKKVMKDPRIQSFADQPVLFDMKRMAVGGFSTIVNKSRR